MRRGRSYESFLAASDSAANLYSINRLALATVGSTNELQEPWLTPKRLMSATKWLAALKLQLTLAKRKRFFDRTIDVDALKFDERIFRGRVKAHQSE